MLELIRRSFVLRVKLCALQMFPIKPNAVLAMPVLVFTSSDPPTPSTTLLRYVKEFTPSTNRDFMVKLGCVFVWTLSTLIFIVLLRRPVSKALLSTSVSFSCICWWLWDGKAMSFTKSRSFKIMRTASTRFHFACCQFFCLIIRSTARKNNNSESRKSCSGPSRPSTITITITIMITMWVSTLNTAVYRTRRNQQVQNKLQRY